MGQWGSGEPMKHRPVDHCTITALAMASSAANEPLIRRTLSSTAGKCNYRVFSEEKKKTKTMTNEWRNWMTTTVTPHELTSSFTRWWSSIDSGEQWAVTSVTEEDTLQALN